jgi:arginyl-tRNA synthetase
MNVLENYLEKIKKIILKKIKELNISENYNFESVNIEVPPTNFDFDLSCNIAMVLGKQIKENPKNLAEKIKKILLKECKDFDSVQVAGPGFINMRLNNSALQNIIIGIYKDKNSYGSNKKNKKYNVEFVSANPTGPMHVGHCRGAVFGDVLSNLLKFNGNKVTKEYYVNDCGNQIKNFVESVFLRLREIKHKEKFKNEKDLYPGEYIIDIANKILKEKPDIDLNNFKNIYNLLKKESLRCSMDLVKTDLNNLGIKHDNFFYESQLIEKDSVNNAVKILKDNNFVEEGFLKPPKGEETKDWKKTKRLIFKSTLFGDDTDRSLQKNDGSWTYFANDVAYHADKVLRNYDFLVDILGADHTGYTKRITAAVAALSNNKVILKCKVCQLVKLYKKGKPFKMSKRAGDFISVNDLLNEVDKDSIRFMMLNRSNDVELDFDFDKVLEKTKDNPVFYVQYCYARISSLFRTLNIDSAQEIKLETDNFKLNVFEKNLLRKIFNWPKVIDSASLRYEPHRIVFYLYDLATLFHSYWSKGNEDEKYKFIIDSKIKNLNTLAIIKLVALVVENGMKILDVSLPKKM